MVYLEGELNFSEVLNFEEAMKFLFQELSHDDSGFPPPVLVECSSMSFIDSAGIATLVGFHLDSRHRMLELGYSGFQDRVLETITRTHVDQFLNHYPNEQEGREKMVERQRIYQRFVLRSEGTLKREDEETVQISCLNISKGGCSVFSKNNFDGEGKVFAIDLGDFEFQADILIRRISPISDGFQIAALFQDSSPEFQKRLVDIIHKLQNRLHHKGHKK